MRVLGQAGEGGQRGRPVLVGVVSTDEEHVGRVGGRLCEASPGKHRPVHPLVDHRTALRLDTHEAQRIPARGLADADQLAGAAGQPHLLAIPPAVDGLVVEQRRHVQGDEVVQRHHQRQRAAPGHARHAEGRHEAGRMEQVGALPGQQRRQR